MKTSRDEDESDDYSYFPSGFLKGVKLIPHNFNYPENPKHSDYVDAQLRHHLFTFCYQNI